MLGARELHVLAQHLEQSFVDRYEDISRFAIDVEGEHDPLHITLHLVSHAWSSISLSAFAHAHRSGATACARLAAGLGSSG